MDELSQKEHIQIKTLAELIEKQINLVQSRLDDGVIFTNNLFETENIKEILGVHKHLIHNTYHHESSRADIHRYFATKKFQIYNVTDIDKILDAQYGENHWVNSSITLDFVDMYFKDIMNFGISRLTAFVVRQWYMILVHKKEKPTYSIKKYTFDELVEEITKGYIANGKNF